MHEYTHQFGEHFIELTCRGIIRSFYRDVHIVFFPKRIEAHNNILDTGIHILTTPPKKKSKKTNQTNKHIHTQKKNEI